MKKNILQKLFIAITCACFSSAAVAQSTTINTNTMATSGYTGGTSTGSGGTAFITFAVENHSGAAIKITEVGNWTATAHNGQTSTIFYSASSLSGAVGTFPITGWDTVSSQIVSGITATAVNKVNGGMEFEIPNNTTYRFAILTTSTNYYSSSGVPNIFTRDGVTLYTGDYQINAANVGYAATLSPRFFTGYITFEPACSALFTQDPSDVSLCASGSTVLAAAADAANKYHWQVNDGTGWKNLGDDAIYSGTGTSSLGISNTTFAMHNYKYRAIATNTTEMCSVPSLAATLSMIPSSNSSVVISADPGANICKNEEVVFHSAYTKGGTSPQYRWLLNGLEIPGETKATLKISTLDNGDIVQCRFISNELCVFESKSPGILFSIVNNLLAEVDISTNYNGGNSYTFIATPKNGGVNPKYYWYVNGKLIAGENGQSYTAMDLNPWDKVTVGMVTSRDCASPKMATSRQATTSVPGVDADFAPLVLSPNPNKGSFAIDAEGIMSNTVSMSVINALGQVVYQAEVPANGGKLHHNININDKAAAGIYVLRLEAGAQQKLVKFTIGH